MKVAGNPIEFEGHKIPVTISIGVASLDEGKDHATPDDLIKDADDKLYASKENGRNRTTS
jgi:diguanylate cyclase (GGDEF)-like protein